MTSYTLELQAVTDSPCKALFEPEEGKYIDTIYHSEARPITWYSLTPTPFDASGDGTGTVKFKPPKCYDYLMYSYLTSKLPALAVKHEYSDSYRIRWCKSVINQMVSRATLNHDGQVVIQSIDRHWLNIETEFYLSFGHDENNYMKLGNHPSIRTFSNMLPSYSLKSYQPWSYSKCSSNAFPLYMLKDPSTLIHEYSFDLEIESLLQMQEFKDGKWEYIKPVLDVLDGLPSDNTVQRPTLWGAYSKIEQREKMYNSCMLQDYTCYSEDIIDKDMQNTSKCGSTTSVGLDGMCKAMFMAAYNETSATYNIHGNYSTSREPDNLSESPIRTCSLNYGTVNKFKDMEFDHFTGPLVKNHFVRSPSPLIGAYSFCYDSNSGVETVANLGALKATLAVRLDDPEDYKWKNGAKTIRSLASQSQSSSDDYRLIVRILVLRKFKIVDGEVVLEI
jgi:hypothetical protein